MRICICCRWGHQEHYMYLTQRLAILIWRVICDITLNGHSSYISVKQVWVSLCWDGKACLLTYEITFEILLLFFHQSKAFDVSTWGGLLAAVILLLTLFVLEDLLHISSVPVKGRFHNWHLKNKTALAAHTFSSLLFLIILSPTQHYLPVKSNLKERNWDGSLFHP